MDNNYSDSYINGGNGVNNTEKNTVNNTDGKTAGSGVNSIASGNNPENIQNWADVGKYPGNTTNNISAKSAYMRLGFGVGILSLTALTVQYICVIIFKFTVPGFTKNIWCQWLLSFFPLYGVALPCMYLVIKKLPKLRIIGEKFSFRQWLTVAAVSFGFLGVGAIIGNIVMNIIGTVTGIDYQSSLESVLGSAPLWQTFLFTVVLAPIGEEFIFRKLLIDRANVYGYPYAILFSGIMFGLFHGNFYQVFYATFIGLALAYIYVRTGKYLLCVSVHALINFVCGFLTAWITRNMDTRELEFITLESVAEAVKMNGGWYVLFVLYDLLIYGCMIAGLVILIVRRKRICDYRKTELQIARADFGRIVFGNVGTICAIVAMSSLFILSLI